MEFKQFLLEDEKSLENAVEAIKRDCSEFLNDSKGLPLFRGFKNKNNLTYVLTHNERQTLSLSKPFTTLFNLYVEEKFGIKNIRIKNSMFGAGTEMGTWGYGKIHFVFPINGYKFVWSPLINDLYDAKDSLSNKFEDNEDKKTNKALKLFNSYIPDIWPNVSFNYIEGDPELFKVYEQIQPTIKLVFDKEKYTDKNLGEALSSGYEIMFQTKAFYAIAVSKDAFVFHHVDKEYKTILDKINEA